MIISEGKLTRTLNAGWYNLPINTIALYVLHVFCFAISRGSIVKLLGGGGGAIEVSPPLLSSYSGDISIIENSFYFIY